MSRFRNAASRGVGAGSRLLGAVQSGRCDTAELRQFRAHPPQNNVNCASTLLRCSTPAIQNCSVCCRTSEQGSAVRCEWREANGPVLRGSSEDYKARITRDDVEVRFDRGHLAACCRNAKRAGHGAIIQFVQHGSQAPKNNCGAWAKSVEKATRNTRKYVMRAEGDVFVFTGPVYTIPVDTLGPTQVWVPKYLYKLVFDQTASRAWAHWLENTDKARAGRSISYDELFRRTRIEFLPGVKPRS